MFRMHGFDRANAGEFMLEELVALGITNKPIIFTLQSKEDRVNYVRMLLQSKTLVLPIRGENVPELLRQIREQERNISGAGHTLFLHPVGRHDDLFWSLCIPCHVAMPFITSGADYRSTGIKPQSKYVPYGSILDT